VQINKKLLIVLTQPMLFLKRLTYKNFRQRYFATLFFQKHMKRIDFLRSLGLTTAASVVVAACSSTTGADPITSGSNISGSSNGSSATDCSVTPSETAGPFPTKNPGQWVTQDIRAGEKGVTMTAKITIKAKSTGCGALKGAVVDIWHCDADGNYSEYGSVSNEHFLRGRQTTDANGLVNFTSIFPGWYPGRSPHIHVHIFDASGKTLLITQIAFPKEVCDIVYGTAKTFYTKGLQDTTNANDGIFRDGFATELAGLSGNITDGYALTHTIVVNA
jgi:protocatechuate 3,4-dioxygenase beta subunit